MLSAANTTAVKLMKMVPTALEALIKVTQIQVAMAMLVRPHFMENMTARLVKQQMIQMLLVLISLIVKINFLNFLVARKEKRSSIFRRPKRKGLDIAYEVTVGFEEAVTGSTRRLTLNDGRSVDIKIPLGIRDGQVIRLNGQGGPGIAGGDKGDALVEIRVAEHPIYKRDGNDIYMRVPISLDEAVLGCDIEVPTPHGRLTVRVPRGTSTGKSLRLKGKGVRKKGSEGNMYMNLEVMLPKTRDVELEKLIKDWSGGDGPALRKKSGI